MTIQDWQNAYEPLPASLETRVNSVLRRLPERRIAVKRPLRTIVLAAAALLALGGVAYAVLESKTADIFGWFYGGSWKEEMQRGDIAMVGQSKQLGDVTFTIEEMVYKTQGEMQGVYGVVRVAPNEGANVVLLPDDLSVDDPAGFLLHYGDTEQELTDEAPSYAELARQRGAKILRVSTEINALLVGGENRLGGCYGQSWLPQEDGSILGIFEMTDGVPHAESYTMELCLHSWEVSQLGLDLRGGDGDTQQTADWTVTVTPETKGE